MKIKFISDYHHLEATDDVKGTFKAIRKRVTDKQNWCEEKFYFVPVTENNLKEGSVFVRGKGHFNIKRSKVFEIPAYEYNGDYNSIQEYAKKYGVEALYYSLRGKQIDMWDTAYSEICSLLNNPKQIELYIDNKLFNAYHKLRKMLVSGLDKLESKLGVVGRVHTPVAPRFKSGLVAMPVYMDSVALDEELCILYRQWRGNALTNELKKKYECDKLDNEIKDLYDAYTNIVVTNPPLGQKKEKLFQEWNGKCENRRHLMSQIIDEVGCQITKELDFDNDIFPTSVKDRFAFFFGEEIAEQYQCLVNLCDSVK